ncbi:MAG: alpha/beta fold hydrolase [Kiloniellales bacterium]
MTRITAGGTAYELDGQGPAVVLVHGMGLNRAMWQWLLPALTRRFQVLSFDLFGHGESMDPVGRPDLRTFSAQILELLDACGLARAAVVGFSLGGMIARRFALDRPDRLSALAILHSAHDRSAAERAAIGRRVETVRKSGPAATVDAALARWFSDDFRTRHPEMMALVRNWVTANRKEVYAPIYRVLAEDDAEIADRITAIRCPTLVMTGAEDFGNSPDMAQRMASAIPGARSVILPGLRHMALAEDPTAFNAPLVSFLTEMLVEQTG